MKSSKRLCRFVGGIAIHCWISITACAHGGRPGTIPLDEESASAEFVALVPSIIDEARKHGPRGVPLLIDVGSFQRAAQEYGAGTIPREQLDRAIGREYIDVPYGDVVLRLGDRRIETVDRGLHVRVGGTLRTPSGVDLLVGMTYTLAEEHHSVLGQATIHLRFMRRNGEWVLLAATPLSVS
jgi:hypothetical protein